MNSLGSARLILCTVVMIALGGCSTTVQPPQGSLGTVAQAQEPRPKVHNTSTALVSDGGEMSTRMAMETEVSSGCVSAWRRALGGKDEKTGKAIPPDQEGAIKQLDELGKKYPKVGTIDFMKGQIFEHFGNRKEAIKLYKNAVTTNEFSAFQIFKLAEALRETGDHKGAVEQYKRMLGAAPDFVPAKVGLAKSLCALDKNSPEAKAQVDEALKLEPDNKGAKELAAKLSNNKTATK